MSEPGNGTRIAKVGLMVIIPLVASAIGAAVGGWASLKVVESRIEAQERQLQSVLVAVATLTTTVSKGIGVLEERGPRINNLEQQVVQLQTRLDRVLDTERRR